MKSPHASINAAGLASAIIAILDDGSRAMSYQQVAEVAPKFGARKLPPIATGRFLDLVTEACEHLGVPPLASVVVGKNFVESPEMALREKRGMDKMKLSPETLAAAQRAVRTFDWSTVPELTDPAFYDRLAKQSPTPVLEPVSVRATPEVAKYIKEVAKLARDQSVVERLPAAMKVLRG